MSPSPSNYTSESVCQDVSYTHRVYNPETWNWCIVPLSSFDAIFFACVAVIVSCSAPPKWNTLISLLSGGVYQLFANYFNLGHVSNASTLWLGISPPDVFVYIFLPPLILDSACRMDFFMLKRVGWNVIFMAFVMVLCSALLLIPFMLYGLNMASRGWDAVYVALFGTMIGATDAASVIAILKSGGAPELLSIILEGESLFNDASSLTMFEIFSEVIHQEQNLGADIGEIVWKTITSFLGGMAIGSLAALFMALMVKWLQLRDMKGFVETVLSLALAYISYYITQIWVECSGVISVVVFGLWGTATLQWGMNSKNLSRGLFLGFYDVFVFILNGIIFFFVGASCANLVIRSQSFLIGSSGHDGYTSLSQFYGELAWRFAAIYVYSFTCRFAFTWFSFEFFRFFKLSEGGNLKQTFFVAMAGLRGSLSLILVQSVIQLASETGTEDTVKARVQAEMALLTALYVLATLVINAPILGPLMTLLGLNTVSEEQLHMQRRVHKLLRKHSETSLEAMRGNPHELMQGVSWDEVQSACHHWHNHGLETLRTEEKRSLRADFKAGWRNFLSYFCIDAEKIEETEMCHAKKEEKKGGWRFFGLFPGSKEVKDAAHPHPGGSHPHPGGASVVDRSSFSRRGQKQGGGQLTRSSIDRQVHPPPPTATILLSDDPKGEAGTSNGAPPHQVDPEDDQHLAAAQDYELFYRESHVPDDEGDDIEKELEDYMANAAEDVCLFAPSSGSETTHELAYGISGDVEGLQEIEEAVDVENPARSPSRALLAEEGRANGEPVAAVVVESVVVESVVVEEKGDEVTLSMRGRDMSTLLEEPEGEGLEGGEGQGQDEGEGEEGGRGQRPPPLDVDLAPLPIKPRANYRIKSSRIELFRLPSLLGPSDLDPAGSQQLLEMSSSIRDQHAEAAAAEEPIPVALPPTLDALSLTPQDDKRDETEEGDKDGPPLSPPLSPGDMTSPPSDTSFPSASLPHGHPSLPTFPTAGSTSSLTGLDSVSNSIKGTPSAVSRLKRKNALAGQLIALKGDRAIATDSDGIPWQAGTGFNAKAAMRAPQPMRARGSLSTSSMPLTQGQGQGGGGAGNPLRAPFGAMMVPGGKQRDLMRTTMHQRSSQPQLGSTSTLGPNVSSGPSDLKELNPASHLQHLNNEKEISAAFGHPLDEGDEGSLASAAGGLGLLPEYRLRVLVGLRQHFRQRKHEGMIGFRSFNLLDYCCKEELHEGLHTPLTLWSVIEAEISKRWYLRWSGAMVFKLRKMMLKVAGTPKGIMRTLKLWCLGTPATALTSFLQKMNQIAMEASVELWMGLTDSDHIQWLEYSGPAGRKLLEEVKSEADKVWEFIVDRRIESPEGFNAIQTYRCTLALLTQQQMFIDELAEDGVLEESEVEKLSHAVLRQRQRVERKGSTSRGAPSILSILSNTDLLRGLPQELIKKVRSQGRLKVFARGEKIWDGTKMKEGEPVDIMLVVFGMIRIEIDDGAGNDKSYYLGSGGAYGLIPNITGMYIPGVTSKAVYAEGNAMGRGPVMFIAPYSALQSIGSLINLEQFEGKLIRKACVQVCDAMKGRTLASLARHVQLLLVEIIDDHHFNEANASEGGGTMRGGGGGTMRGGGGGTMRGSFETSAPPVAPTPLIVPVTPLAAPAPRPSAEAAGPFARTSRWAGSDHEGGGGGGGGGQANAAARLHLSTTKITTLLALPLSSTTDVSSLSSDSKRGGLPLTLLTLDHEVALHLIDPEADLDDEDPATRQALESKAHYEDPELKEHLARAIASRARSVYDEIQQRLGRGELFVLAPGQRYVQERTSMLIQGSLYLPTEDGEGEGGEGLGGKLGDMQHSAPSLLFWSPDFFEHAISGGGAGGLQGGQFSPPTFSPSAASIGPPPSVLGMGPEGGHALVAGPHGAKLILT